MTDSKQCCTPFASKFLPGLAVGLLVGGLAGAFLPPVVERWGAGGDVPTPPQTRAPSERDARQADIPQPAVPPEAVPADVKPEEPKPVDPVPEVKPGETPAAPAPK